MVFYFDRISVKEGISLECYDEQHDKVLNETISKRCSGCRVVFYNSNNFKYKGRTCDRCYKMLFGTSFEPRQAHVIWWNNSKYRIMTTLKCCQAQRLMEKVKPQDRYGYVDIDSFEV